VSHRDWKCVCKPGFRHLDRDAAGPCYIDPCYYDFTNGGDFCDRGIPGGVPTMNEFCVIIPDVLVAGPGGAGTLQAVQHACICEPGYYGTPPICLPLPPPMGMATNCGSGIISVGFCAPNHAGGKCAVASDCFTLNCAVPAGSPPSAQKVCQKSQLDESCGQNSDCTSDLCDTIMSLRCLPNSLNGKCVTDTDCMDGLFCFRPFHHEEGERHEPYCAVDRCADNNGACDPAANCLPVGPGLRICSCPQGQGFFGSGYEFDPATPGSGCVNPCLTDNGGCAPTATCTPLSYDTVSCACPAPTVGDGVGPFGCVPNACLTFSGSYAQPGDFPSTFYGCPSDAVCFATNIVNYPTAFLSCRCNDPHKVYIESQAVNDVGSCVISPCTEHICGDHARCSANSRGLAQCTCHTGFAPAGITFAPGGAECKEDPCLSVGPDGLPNNGGCDRNAECTSIETFVLRFHRRPHTEEDRICTCNQPWIGDGFYCVADPCLAPLANPCGSLAGTVCQAVFHPPGNIKGPRIPNGPIATTTCACLAGYVPLGPEGTSNCVPSCENDNGGCDATTSCHMEGHTVTCKCRAGYTFGGAFGVQVAVGTACLPTQCTLGALPEHYAAGTCGPPTFLGMILTGQTCTLACAAPATQNPHVDATLTCRGATHGSQFSSIPKHLCQH